MHDISDARLLFGEAPERYGSTLLPFQQDIYEQAQEMREALQQAHAKGELTPEIRNEAIFNLQEQYYTRQERLRQQAEAKLDELEAEYQKERNPAGELLEMQRSLLRLEAMGAQEIQAEVEEYLKAPEGRAPATVEALLSHAAKKLSKPMVDQLRRKMQTAGYDRPWTHTEEGKQLVRLRDLLSAKFGMARVIGEMGVEDVALAGLFTEAPLKGKKS